jgi:hypothetical protein
MHKNQHGGQNRDRWKARRRQHSSAIFLGPDAGKNGQSLILPILPIALTKIQL